MNYNFEQDLAISSKTETEIATLLKGLSPNIVDIDYCNNADYDLSMKMKDGTIKLVEIKEDFFCKKSGNIAIEYECRGKVSGIYRTKASIMLYKVHTNQGISYHACTTAKMLESIGNQDFFRIVSGGDAGSNTKMYLYKFDKFKEICKQFHKRIK